MNNFRNINHSLPPLLLFCFAIPKLCIATADVLMADNIFTDMSIEELMNIEVVIATKRLQRASDAPSSVTVFTQAEITQMGVRNVQDLLNFVPGFQSSRESVFNQGSMVSARGTSTPQASYNILFMIDGQRINDDSSGGALIANRFLATENIKQIEVIRGPGSALYGTSAFSGVVNIITNSDSNRLSITGSSHNGKEFTGQLSTQQDDWGISIFGRYRDDNGQRYDTSSTPNRDPIDRDVDTYLTARWKDLHLHARYAEEQLSGFISPIADVVKNKQQFIKLDYDLLNTDEWFLNVYGGYLSTRVISNAKTRDNEPSAGFDSRYSFNDQHQLSLGFEWREPEVDQGSTILKTKRSILGVYLQDTYRFNDQLELTLGARYTNYSDVGDSINPRVAVVYRNDWDSTFKVLYGHAFRAPSVRQLLSTNVGNSTLKSETIKTLEFAWLQEFKQLKTSVTYFYSLSKDKIDTVVNIQAGNPLSRQFVNFNEKIKTSGLEFELHAFVYDDFSIRSTFTHLLEYEKNPRRVARNTFSLIANYQKGPFNLNINTYYHDDMETETRTSTLTLEDYWVVNSNLRYSLNESFTVVGRVDNLFDEEYFSSTKIRALNKGIPNRGRSFSVGLEASF